MLNRATFGKEIKLSLVYKWIVWIEKSVTLGLVWPLYISNMDFLWKSWTSLVFSYLWLSLSLDKLMTSLFFPFLKGWPVFAIFWQVQNGDQFAIFESSRKGWFCCFLKGPVWGSFSCYSTDSVWADFAFFWQVWDEAHFGDFERSGMGRFSHFWSVRIVAHFAIFDRFVVVTFSHFLTILE